jgi:hypothetical protein
MKLLKQKTPHIPTDLEILDAIYERYYQTFASFIKGESDRSVKIYVPIDLKAIAAALNVDGDLVFGRPYYHLESKYGYIKDDRSHVYFFCLSTRSPVSVTA